MMRSSHRESNETPSGAFPVIVGLIRSRHSQSECRPSRRRRFELVRAYFAGKQNLAECDYCGPRTSPECTANRWIISPSELVAFRNRQATPHETRIAIGLEPGRLPAYRVFPPSCCVATLYGSLLSVAATGKFL